jgi:hypothetical protein
MMIKEECDDMVCSIKKVHFYYVGNVHLESMNSRAERKAQLKIAAKCLASAPSLLLGDFNFCSHWNWVDMKKNGRWIPGAEEHRSPLENDVLHEVLPTFVDAWIQHYPPETPGFTFDSTVNRMVAEFTEYEQMRYDRVLYNLPPAWQLESITMIGTYELNPAPQLDAVDGYSTPPPRQPSTYISDHFGLLAQFHRLSRKSILGCLVI